jgi:K+-transporting ATPase KdpF subunit
MLVNGWIVLAALLAAGLLVYLVAVLLRPEDFS